MSKTPVGARVGAIASANDTEVHLYGYGVYDGDHEPPLAPGETQEARDAGLKKLVDAGLVPADFKFTNPRITLDSGAVVWGMQCYWGPEAKIRAFIGDRKVVSAIPD
jgi:hypothetical protein